MIRLITPFYISIPFCPHEIFNFTIIKVLFLFFYISEIRSTTTTLPSTISATSTTTARSTTMKTTRKRVYTTPKTTTEFYHRHSTEPSNEFDLEFATDFPGSNSLFYPGVESYQHHINYINSQDTLCGNFRLHWFSMSVLLLLRISWWHNWWMELVLLCR